MNNRPKTRLAPSPTGALHLGNARTFLISWLWAKQNNAQIILRVEDIDGPRVKPQATRQAMEDLLWLKLTWDGEPIIQSNQLEKYQELIRILFRLKRCYFCTCSRSEIESAASAPHGSDGANIYPGTCRGKYQSEEDAINQSGRRPCVRFDIGATHSTYHDMFAGKVMFENLQRQLGDFVIGKADGTPAYQLATAEDDITGGITHVFRANDLIESTPRQVLLMHALYPHLPVPSYAHVPLVVGEDGRRLAKRHGDTRLSTYRDMGVPVERIFRLLSHWCGMKTSDHPTMDELINQFDLSALPREHVIMGPPEHAFLLGQGSLPPVRFWSKQVS